jgi:hypothetical protein
MRNNHFWKINLRIRRNSATRPRQQSQLRERSWAFKLLKGTFYPVPFPEQFKQDIL